VKLHHLCSQPRQEAIHLLKVPVPLVDTLHVSGPTLTHEHSLARLSTLAVPYTTIRTKPRHLTDLRVLDRQ
jgi:hypothetical protein